MTPRFKVLLFVVAGMVAIAAAGLLAWPRHQPPEFVRVSAPLLSQEVLTRDFITSAEWETDCYDCWKVRLRLEPREDGKFDLTMRNYTEGWSEETGQWRTYTVPVHGLDFGRVAWIEMPHDPRLPAYEAPPFNSDANLMIFRIPGEGATWLRLCPIADRYFSRAIRSRQIRGVVVNARRGFIVEDTEENIARFLNSISADVYIDGDKLCETMWAPPYRNEPPQS